MANEDPEPSASRNEEAEETRTVTQPASRDSVTIGPVPKSLTMSAERPISQSLETGSQSNVRLQVV